MSLDRGIHDRGIHVEGFALCKAERKRDFLTRGPVPDVRFRKTIHFSVVVVVEVYGRWLGIIHQSLQDAPLPLSPSVKRGQNRRQGRPKT